MPPVLALLLLPLLPTSAPAQVWPPPEERFLDWTDLSFPPAE